MKKTTLFAFLITASLASTMAVAQTADFSPINKKTPAPVPQGQVQTNKVRVDTKVTVPTTPPTVTTPVPTVPPVPTPTTPAVTPVPTVPPVVPPTPQPHSVPGTTPKVPATPHAPDAKGKVTINHKGRVMTVDEHSLKGHLAHGDTVVAGGNNHEDDKDKDKGKGKGKGKGKNKGAE